MSGRVARYWSGAAAEVVGSVFLVSVPLGEDEGEDRERAAEFACSHFGSAAVVSLLSRVVEEHDSEGGCTLLREYRVTIVGGNEAVRVAKERHAEIVGIQSLNTGED